MSANINAAAVSLKRLIDGNARFVSGLRSVESLTSFSRVKELAEKGQSPFACLLSCSDSRVPAEILFDCGIGELFVNRVAGNVASPGMIASVQFAALKLKTPLCLVMGHSLCGAVEAAFDDKELPSEHLNELVDEIRDAVQIAREANPKASREELLLAASWENVRLQRDKLLEKSPSLRHLVTDGSLGVECALYDLHTGIVHFEASSANGAPALAQAARRSR